MQLVEERAPNGFVRIEDVISHEELETISPPSTPPPASTRQPSTRGRRSCDPNMTVPRAQLYAFTDLTGRFAPEAAGPERLFRSVASMAAKNSK